MASESDARADEQMRRRGEHRAFYRGTPSEFVSPDVVADRIWARVALLPIPHEESERGEITRLIFRAFREDLGTILFGLETVFPPTPASEAPPTLDAMPTTVLTRIRQETGDLEKLSPSEESPVAQATAIFAEAFSVPLDDVDMWSQFLVHRDRVYGVLIMGRAKSRPGGAITETDRNVIFALEDRFAALLAEWYEASLPREG